MAVDLKHTVLHSFKWMAFSRFSAQLLRWAATLLVIRVLTPEDFGIVALAEPVIGFMELIASMGMGAAIIRSQSITQSELRSIFTMIAVVDFFLFLTLFITAPYISQFYQQDELILVLRVLATGFLMTAFESIPSALLAKEMKFKAIGIIQIMAGFVGAIVSLVLAFNGFGYWSLVIGGLSIQMFRTIAVLLIQPVLLLPTIYIRAAWRFVSFGGFVLASSIAWYLSISLDIIIAGRFWTAETLGIYAVALQLAAMPLNKMMPPVKKVALPAYSRTQTNKVASRYYMIKSLRLAMGIGFPFFFGLAGISSILVPVLLDIKWTETAAPLTFLFLAMPFRMFFELHGPAVLARGNPQLVFRNQLVILIVMTSGFLFAVQYNPIVLASVWVVLFPLLAIYFSRSYCRYLKINFIRLLKNVIPSFIISLAMFFIVRIFIITLENIVSPVMTLGLGILVGAGFYFVSLVLFDRSMLKEYVGLIR